MQSCRPRCFRNADHHRPKISRVTTSSSSLNLWLMTSKLMMKLYVPQLDKNRGNMPPAGRRRGGGMSLPRQKLQSYPEQDEPATSEATIKPLTAHFFPILQVEKHPRRQLLYGAMDQALSSSFPAFNPAIMRGRRWDLDEIHPYPAILDLFLHIQLHSTITYSYF